MDEGMNTQTYRTIAKGLATSRPSPALDGEEAYNNWLARVDAAVRLFELEGYVFSIEHFYALCHGSIVRGRLVSA